jgi:hypothetical protein
MRRSVPWPVFAAWIALKLFALLALMDGSGAYVIYQNF